MRLKVSKRIYYSWEERIESILDWLGDHKLVCCIVCLLLSPWFALSFIKVMGFIASLIGKYLMFVYDIFGFPR